MMKNEMLRKIENREIVVGVVGLGYVGLPLAVEKAKAGFKTIGFDVQAQKVEMVNAGHNYIGDVVDSDLAGIVKSGMLSATTDFSFVKDVDFVAICVPTPLDAHQQPDISYVRDSATSVSKYLKKGTMVVLESTTYPGTTEELIKPILEQGSGLKCGEDFYLGFSPERVDPGNLIYKTKNTPKVVGAIGKDATEVIAAMYRAVLDGEEFWTVAPTPVKAVDTIGAGDGYLAAVAAGLVWGKNLKEATQWASKYAAYKVTRKGSMTRKPGMGYPELAEVEAFMEAHP